MDPVECSVVPADLPVDRVITHGQLVAGEINRESCPAIHTTALRFSTVVWTAVRLTNILQLTLLGFPVEDQVAVDGRPEVVHRRDLNHGCLRNGAGWHLINATCADRRRQLRRRLRPRRQNRQDGDERDETNEQEYDLPTSNQCLHITPFKASSRERECSKNKVQTTP